MKTNHPFLSALLVLLGLLCVLPAEAKESRAADQNGDLEHFHHEYYSHSYIDPGYQNEQEQGSGSISKAAPHKKHHRDGRPETGVSVAFGGHKHSRH